MSLVAEVEYPVQKKSAQEQEYLKTVGVRLRIYRRVKRLTMEDMAKTIGLSLREYHHIERGEKDFGITVAYRICMNFGLSIEEMFYTHGRTIEEFRQELNAVDWREIEARISEYESRGEGGDEGSRRSTANVPVLRLGGKANQRRLVRGYPPGQCSG